MQNLAIVYFPQIHNELLDSFRQKFDSAYKKIAPHITLMYPIIGVTTNEAKTHLEAFAKEIEPFSINIQGLQKTDDDYLFLLVKEGNDKIIAFQKSLCSGALASYVPEYVPYTPHVTLGCFRSDEGIFDSQKYKQAYVEAQAMDTGFLCNFDSVSLLRGDESHTEIVHTYRFGK